MSRTPSDNLYSDFLMLLPLCQLVRCLVFPAITCTLIPSCFYSPSECTLYCTPNGDLNSDIPFPQNVRCPVFPVIACTLIRLCSSSWYVVLCSQPSCIPRRPRFLSDGTLCCVPSNDLYSDVPPSTEGLLSCLLYLNTRIFIPLLQPVRCPLLLATACTLMTSYSSFSGCVIPCSQR